MGAADKIGNVIQVAGLAFLTFQPAAGIECMITNCSSIQYIGGIPIASYEIYVFMTNGVINSIVAGSTWNPDFFNRLKLLINNSIYLTIQNRNVNPRQLSYTGIQIK